MRDPNRLYKFYDELLRIHITYYPDWRFCQLVSNIEAWLKTQKGIADIFYIEETQFLKLMREYVGEG